MKPDDFVMSIERYSVSLTSIIGWGRRIKKTNDEVAQLSLVVMKAIPVLSKLPSFIYSTPPKIKAGAELFSKHFCFLTQEGAKVDGPTFAANLIEAQPKMNLSNKEVSALAANLIGGGVDTTSSTVFSLIPAMAYFPDVQKKVQAEFDAVVGQDRSPNWDDVDKRLPYQVVTVKEVLRWRTVTILAGIPHANTVDLEYRGYHIPAGRTLQATCGQSTVILVNSLIQTFYDPKDF